MYILIVDDDMSSRLYLQAVLARFGEIVLAGNGMEAYELFLLSHEQGRSFDVIFMDVKMPTLDGYQATQKIRQWEKDHSGGDRSVVIMATAYAFQSDALDSFKSGADLHLPKPYSPKQVEGFLWECGFRKKR